MPGRERCWGRDTSLLRRANSSLLIAAADEGVFRLELHGLLGHIDDDLQRGRLARPVIDLGAAFRRAEELSRKHASKTLARTLDVLHVAALIEIGCKTLVSGDERQITLAKAAGLRALDIRAGT
jgi:predicted nucleic acid-binding protein